MRIERACVLALAIGALAGCGEREDVPYAPPHDPTRGDGSVIIVGPGGSVGGRDAGGAIDAALDDGGRRAPPRIDGRFDENEWQGAVTADANLAPADFLPFDELLEVRAIRTETTLYIGIAGTVGPERSIILLLDADFGLDRGIVLTPVSIDDLEGSLDRAISNSALSTTIPDFLPDYAWGSRSVSSVSGWDDQTGWRSLAIPDDLTAIGDARTVCSSACETSIALGPTGIVDPRVIAIAVRTTSTEGALSNQTLPGNDDPGVIEMVLAVPPPDDTAL